MNGFQGPGSEGEGPATLADEASGEVPAVESSSGRRMVKDNLSVAAGTAVSRVTGVVRLLALYAAVRPDLRDAYLLANNTPNIIYELILGGVLTATLVPLFTANLEDRDDEATHAVVSVTLVALVALVGITMVLAPVLIGLYSSNPGKGVDPGVLRSVGVRLSLLFAPQVLFYGVMALGSAVLNSRRRFFAAAWAPVLNNVIVSAVLLSVPLVHGSKADLLTARSDTGILLLMGLGTTAGIVTMAVALLPALRRSGYHFRFRPQWRHPAVKRALTMSGWTIGYVIANQVAALIVNILAKPGSGNVTNYQVAFQFFQLPHGLLAVSLMTTFQPELARAAVRHDLPGFHRQLLLGLQVLLLVVVPAAVGYLVLPGTLSDIGLHARVTGIDVDAFATMRVLSGFALGLIGFSAYLFILRGFYAHKDTKTPFFLNVAENAVNVLAAVVLVGRFGVWGLGMAFAIAYTVAAILSQTVLMRRYPGFDLRSLLGTMQRVGISAAAMGLAVWLFLRAVVGAGGERMIPATVASIVIGVVVYAGGVLAFREPQRLGLAARLRRPRGTA